MLPSERVTRRTKDVSDDGGLHLQLAASLARCVVPLSFSTLSP